MSTIMDGLPTQEPDITLETQPFWDAARDGKLLIVVCSACGRAHWHPRSHCPFCFSDVVGWREAVGRGTIYSYSIARRATVPYALAYVTLEEGVTIMTNIIGCGFDELAIDQLVEVVFRSVDGGEAVPAFRPVALD